MCIRDSIRFNQWLHNSGTGGVSQVDGGHVGIGTTNPLIPVGSGNTAILNVGVVTANSYYGSGAQLTGITQTTINNNADNRVITGSGTANTLNGEANLTFDGNHLTLNTSSSSSRIYLTSGNSDDSSIYFGAQDDTATGAIRYDHSDDSLRFYGYNNSERLRIDSSGRFLKGLTGAGASRSSTSVRYPHFQLSSPWSSGLGSYKIECTDDYPIIFLDSNASYANGTGAGTVTWSVKDSSGDYCNTASILSKIDATPSNDSAPGRLEFLTTTSGSTPTTKMTIDSGGSVLKPLNPAFYANNLSNNAVYTAGTIIPWPNTNVDLSLIHI